MKRLLALMVLAGCTTTAQPAPTGRQDTCQAARFAGLIGQNATILETTLLLGQVRVIRPGDAVTMDFLPDRINFMIDDADDIASIRCG